jgi:molybdenum cofactor guanylyltransferase
VGGNKNKPIGLILAGGKSSRMGEEKAFVQIGTKTLLEHVYTRLNPQCERVFVSTNSDDPRFAPYHTISDTIDGQLGPLAGILAGLQTVQNTHEWLVTTPCDCPFLPEDLVERFSQTTDALSLFLCGRGETSEPSKTRTPSPCKGKGWVESKIILAASNTQIHHTTGLWHTSLIEPLKHALNNGIRKVQDFTEHNNPQYIEWSTTPIDPFFNINTQADLAIACLKKHQR